MQNVVWSSLVGLVVLLVLQAPGAGRVGTRESGQQDPARANPSTQNAEGQNPEGQNPEDQNPQTPSRNTTGLPPPSAEVLQRANELARLHPEHEQLEQLTGDWQIATKTWSSGDGEPHEDTGTVSGRTMLGGRYVALSFRLQAQGRQIEALQVLGYDALRSLYTASWRDDASTWSTDCVGEARERPDVLVLRGKLVDARTPRGRAFRLTFDLTREREVRVTIHEDDGGDEVLLQEQVWTPK